MIIGQHTNGYHCCAGLCISVVSNNCSNPALTWAGEAADLAGAAAAIAAARRSGPMLAISCSLLLLPEHNVSRIIEHALLRNTSVCCFSRLSSSDLQLDAGASPGAAAPGSKSSSGSRSSSIGYGRLMIAADVPAPPLDGIEVRARPQHEGVLHCYSRLVQGSAQPSHGLLLAATWVSLTQVVTGMPVMAQ
jgi:hypothetical protein